MLLFSTCLLVACLVSGVVSDCSEMSHNGCKIGDDLAYLELYRERDLCQQYCSIEPKCKFWRWTDDARYGFNCFLYEEDFSTFVRDCDFISGPKNPQANCFNPREGTCDLTQQARCIYGNGKLEDEVVQSKEFCQQLCAIDSNCQRWVYNKEESTCETISIEEQDCHETFGPRDITPVACGEAVETTLPPTGTPPTPPIPNDCPADSELVTYPDEDDCMYYWQCYNGVWSHYMCPDCEKFDPASGYCKQPSIVECGDRPYDNNCQATTAPGLCPYNDGYFPYDDNCIKYIHCIGGTPEVITCDKKTDDNGYNRQLLYNDDGIMCDWTWRVSCGNRPACDTNEKNCQCQGATPVDPNQVCPPNDPNPIVLPDPFNCRNILVCLNGAQVDMVTCPDNQYVDNQGNCVADEKVCDTRPICAESDGATSCYCV